MKKVFLLIIFIISSLLSKAQDANIKDKGGVALTSLYCLSTKIVFFFIIYNLDLI